MPILARQRELSRRLSDRHCAADHRIQAFLDDYLADTGEQPQLPRRTLVLDEPGLARELSLPFDGDDFSSPLLSSYRLVNGVLHNPANDRRTTAGVVPHRRGRPADPRRQARRAEGRSSPGCWPAPSCRRRPTWCCPTRPTRRRRAACFVSLQLRPLVSPEVPGSVREKRMETRFIVPGGLVANLDFVECIFGNGGDPYLPENDASLAPETLDRPHRLRHPRAAPDPGHQEGASACRTSARPPSASSATACAGRPTTSSTTAARPSRSALP